MGFLGLIGLSLVAGLAEASAQSVPVRGTVSIGGVPADSGTVVLHQVSTLFSGETDSVSVAEGGTFELFLPHAPGTAGEGEVFFLSVRFDGILYFGVPLGTDSPIPDSYSIEAYPAETVTGDGTPLFLNVRNVLLQPSEDGWLATDLFGLVNPGGTTLVAQDGARVWEHDLPSSATDFTVGQSDLAPNGASFVDGRLAVSAAFPPGEQVFLIRYRLVGDTVVVPVTQLAEQFEILMLDPMREMSVDGLLEADPVVLEGTEYRRFAGVRLAPTVIEVTRGRSERNLLDFVPWLAAGLALLLVAIGALVSARASSRVRTPRNRKEILLAIARLDEAQSGPDRLPDVDYERRRDRWMAQLSKLS